MQVFRVECFDLLTFCIFCSRRKFSIKTVIYPKLDIIIRILCINRFQQISLELQFAPFTYIPEFIRIFIGYTILKLIRLEEPRLRPVVEALLTIVLVIILSQEGVRILIHEIGYFASEALLRVQVQERLLLV